MINVSSSLAFVPDASVPPFCATKAAVHSYRISLREQLRGNLVAVIEVAPPLTKTDLMPREADNSDATPLGDFIDELMPLLDRGDDEAIAAATRPFRDAEREGQYDEMVRSLAQATT
ncbi:SDR family NAD(P)-dependent oxidoreductase [Sphingomonas sp. DC2300-3]|uniref:SDR family NAD(P)-dependent oxidoreductase n=1 Tax=unclassified Sphingomonas TaxID=196159 RepID=UPI000FBD78A1